jgi:two-component system cell cycle sensor histidine kinase/response regulator CckA
MVNPEHLRPADPSQPVLLLVEDDVMVLNITRITLELEGFFVLTAENGEDALFLSRKYPDEIHVLVTDVVMPKMSGVELSRHISAERPTTRIVVMSGNTFEEEISSTWAFIPKPFGLKQLRETVSGLVPVSRQLHEDGALTCGRVGVNDSWV